MDDIDDEAYFDFPTWQRALLENPNFANLKYIKEQLQSLQASLMTKLVLGKLVVKGQMRYMARDLPFMLVNLIQSKEVREQLRGLRIPANRFYLPQGDLEIDNLGLDSTRFCGFFRSPHLSRNEQGVLAPLIPNDNLSLEHNDIKAKIEKYFKHLTGVVMFGYKSLEPMALGGADFDGDLSSMIVDEDVVNAMLSGLYVRAHDENGNEKIDFCHNPISMPKGGLEALKTMEPLDIVAYQYDLVCNGYEMASGAVRNHNPEIMVKAFEIAGYKEEDVAIFKFSFMGLLPYLLVLAGVVLTLVNAFAKKGNKIFDYISIAAFVVSGVLFFIMPNFMVFADNIAGKIAAEIDYELAVGAIVSAVAAVASGAVVLTKVLLKK
jgi:hypothetical protein